MKEIIRSKLVGGVLMLLVACAAISAQAQTASKKNGEEMVWDSIICRGAKCEPLKARGWLFVRAGEKAVVIISHGSVGIDQRVFDRVDQIQDLGMAALVIDHWGSRGLSEVLSDLKGAASKGASELNMSFDIYTAASVLRRERNFEKVGTIGASFGGAAQIMAQQKWVKSVIEKTYEYHYRKPFVVRRLDAQVGLYTWCGYRNKLRDSFNGAPLLIINGDKDTQTPSRLCEQLAPWMNEHGGNVRAVTLKGEVHGFDDRRRQTWIPNIVHMGKCDLMIDEKGTTNLTTGNVTKITDFNAALPVALKECATERGFSNGNSGDWKVAVPLWTKFLQDHLHVEVQ